MAAPAHSNVPYVVFALVTVLVVIVLAVLARRQAQRRRAAPAVTVQEKTVQEKTLPQNSAPAGQNGRLLAERFTLADELGRGGMGVVWRATDNLLGRQVAIKQILSPPGLSAQASATMRARMLREARAAAQLDHPNAVTVHDVMVDHESVLIVMELVKASSLHEIVRRDGPLPFERVTAIGRQMLAVLTAAHGIGIIHRDVKPANVLVGMNGSVKLADFGIARFEGDPTLTEVGAIMGTPAYMAPEQIRGRESSSPTDIWGLGVTLYYAIEGRPAFDGTTPTSALAAVLTDEPLTPRRADPVFSRLLLDMLAKDPHDRPAADRLRAELSRLGT